VATKSFGKTCKSGNVEASFLTESTNFSIIKLCDNLCVFVSGVLAGINEHVRACCVLFLSKNVETCVSSNYSCGFLSHFSSFLLHFLANLLISNPQS